MNSHECAEKKPRCESIDPKRNQTIEFDAPPSASKRANLATASTAAAGNCAASWKLSGKDNCAVLYGILTTDKLSNQRGSWPPLAKINSTAVRLSPRGFAIPIWSIAVVHQNSLFCSFLQSTLECCPSRSNSGQDAAKKACCLRKLLLLLLLLLLPTYDFIRGTKKQKLSTC